jgi:GT2 family glycosyltransferase
MIPVLGVPILNGPEHLDKMLASIDYPVGRVVVIDNGDVVDGLVDETIIKPRSNLGVAASWNFIIRSFSAPWWLITNHDIIFSPGDLARLAERMDGDADVAMLGGFSVFAVSKAAISKVGWFDENFSPAYYEDNDFDYRCRLAGIPIRALPASLVHMTSSTLRESPEYRNQNGSTFGANKQRYLDKWGGEPYREKFTTPFDAGGDFRDWRLDIDRLEAQRWVRDIDQ